LVLRYAGALSPGYAILDQLVDFFSSHAIIKVYGTTIDEMTLSKIDKLK
jgi:hypothetical protein